ncbi:hypothetical protein ACFXA3_00810 [Streptomyces sp. NPDC059456]|uniref:hypothetical protein n=1 Tax=Streptomyces sp. NPDC059456 TaxID=3346838 RepID=UPI00367F7ED1
MRTPIARRAGLCMAAAAAVALSTTVTSPASAAYGKVQVVLGTPEGGSALTAPRKVIENPVDDHCYTVKEVFPDAPEGSTFLSVHNGNTNPIYIYETDACSGAPADATPLSVGMGVIGRPLLSFKVKPGPEVPSMPTSFPTSQP